MKQILFGVAYAGQAPVDVEHYRPKGKVAGEPKHPGYWWLAMAWDNLLPSCIDCNRRRWQDLPAIPSSLTELNLAPVPKEGKAQLGKQDVFPVAGIRAAAEGASLAGEKPLLLDPTRDQPDDHLEYYLDEDNPLGLVLPKFVNGHPSAEGLTSIHVYGLNRLGLVQERTRIIRRLVFLSGMIDELGEVAGKLRAGSSTNKQMAARLDVLVGQLLAEIRRMAEDDQPYCSLVRAWIKAQA